MIEWYNYSVFRFTREQMIWAIEHRILYSRGKWPLEPSEYETDEYEPKSKEWVRVIVQSSYVDLQGKRPFKPNAYYVSPKTIWAEITRRLKLTGVEGKLLIKEIECMKEPKYNDIEFHEAKDALNYISGWRGRKQSYREWKMIRNYERKP